MPNASEEARVLTAAEIGFSSKPMGPGNTVFTGNSFAAHTCNAIKFSCIFVPAVQSAASMVLAFLQESEASSGPWQTYGGMQTTAGLEQVGSALVPQVANVVGFQAVNIQFQQPLINPTVTNWTWIIDGSRPEVPRLNCNYLRLQVQMLGAQAGDLLTITARTKRFIG